MKRAACLIVLWGGVLAAGERCQIAGEVRPLFNRDTRVPDNKLLTVHVTATTCERWFLGTTVTVETKQRHAATPGDAVKLESLRKTPHGKELVIVVGVETARSYCTTMADVVIVGGILTRCREGAK